MAYDVFSVPADAGIRFGQYVLLRRIARGGMAEVFLAQQRGLEGFDRRVAVKRILPHLADSADFVKMFLAEAKLAAQLSHPNIVHIYEFGKVDHDYFIAMEYVDGVHSGQLFTETGEKLSPTLVARIGADAAAALHHAHELRAAGGKPLGLVHRDVSPANLMISYDGVVKLCDFGIAKAAAVSDQLTNPGQVKGKYAYMSPEQTVAQPLDGRSDVFSLAIVLWELLAGRYIVPRGDAVVAMRAIRDGKIEPLAQVAPGTPPPLVQAIAWALENKREKRATAAELAQALEAYIKSSPELATPMQLAAWVRQRFPRESTGQEAQAGGTQAHPGTAAAPGTQAHPGTVAGGTTPPQPEVGASMVTPGQLIGASRVDPAIDEASGPGNDTGTQIFIASAREDARDRFDGDTLKRSQPVDRNAARGQGSGSSDTLRDSQQIIVPDLADKPSFTGATLIDPRPSAAFEPTVLEANRTLPGDDEGDVTIERGADPGFATILDRPRSTLPGPHGVSPSGARPVPPPSSPQRLQSTGPVAPPTGPRVPPSAPQARIASARPPATRVTTPAQQRRRRRIIAAAGLGGLALVSFLIALAASSSRGGTQTTAAAATSDAQVAAVAPASDARAQSAVNAIAIDAAAAGSAAIATPTIAIAADAAVERPPTILPDAAPSEAFLEVTTDPPGGTVRVGDQARPAPAKFVLLAGDVVVTAELDGYAPLHERITLVPNDHMTLPLAFAQKLPPPHAAALGKLTLRSSPSADVFENGKKLGETPLVELELPAGPHTLVLKNPLHPMMTRKVVIRAGLTTKVSYDLP